MRCRRCEPVPEEVRRAGAGGHPRPRGRRRAAAARRVPPHRARPPSAGADEGARPPGARAVSMMGGRRAFSPRGAPDRPADAAVRRANLKRVAALFRPYRWRLGGVLVLIVCSSLLGIASPFLLRSLINDALPNHDVRLLSWLAGGMIAIALVTQALGVLQTYTSNVVGQEVLHDLRSAVYDHLQRLSRAFFTRARTGDVQSRISNDIGGVE